MPIPILTELYPQIYDLSNIVGVFLMGLITLLYVLKKAFRNLKIPRTILLICLYWAYLGLTVAFNGGSVLSCLLRFIQVCGLFSFLSLLKTKEKVNKFIGVFYVYLALLVCLNVVTQIVIPTGIIQPSGTSWQPQYILKNANSFVFYYLFALILGTISSIMKKGKVSISVFCLSVIEIFSFYLCGGNGSSTGLVIIVCSLFGLLCVEFGWFKTFRKLFYRYTYGILFVFITFLIYIILFPVHTIIFGVLQFITGESVSLLARVVIWQTAWTEILKAPLFGHGTAMVEFVYSVFEGELRSAHNNFLQIFYFGGIIAIVIYLAIIITSAKAVHRSYIHNIKFISLFFVFLILYLLIFMVEQQPLFMDFYYYLIISVMVLPFLKGSANVKKNVSEKNLSH